MVAPHKMAPGVCTSGLGYSGYSSSTAAGGVEDVLLANSNGQRRSRRALASVPLLLAGLVVVVVVVVAFGVRPPTAAAQAAFSAVRPLATPARSGSAPQLPPWPAARPGLARPVKTAPRRPADRTVARAVPDAAAILPPQLTDNEGVQDRLDQGTKVLASTQVQYVYHEAQDHPMALVVAAAALVAGYALWASRRTILWKLAQQQGYPEDVETVINKYCVETTPMKKGRSSAKFGVVSPLWNRNEQLAMKVSSGLQSWQQERDMFQKLRGGGGPFVQLYDAVPNYNGRGANMLIQECGDQDLLDCINERGPLPIRDTRKYGRQALRSVQALHRKGLVWCDCKPENFILVNGKLKAIDLETVVPVGADIPGFTPEVAPPELAIWERPPRRTAALAAQKSYDMWSLGMVLLHMHLGRSYWDGTTNSTIISSMRAQGFEVDLSEVRDPVLASLLKGLLQTDPKRRFNATIAAAHPFWLLP